MGSSGAGSSASMIHARNGATIGAADAHVALDALDAVDRHACSPRHIRRVCPARPSTWISCLFEQREHPLPLTSAARCSAPHLLPSPAPFKGTDFPEPTTDRSTFDGAPMVRFRTSMASFIGSKRTATFITYLLLGIFCLLIGAGWWYLLEPTVGIDAIAGGVSLLLATLAALCARQIGQLRADAMQSNARPPWYRGWRPYLFLSVVSALGTLNAAFVIFESRAILRNDIALVRIAYSNLRDAAHQALSLQSYADKAAKVDALLQTLHSEIVNPNGGNYCGVGDSARQIIAAITLQIPSYHVLRGPTPHACVPNDPVTEHVYRSYEDMAHQLLRDDPDYIAEKGPQKASFLAALDGRYAEMRRALDQLEFAASGIGSTTGLDMKSLYVARSNYNADRLTFLSFTEPSQWNSLEPIDVLQSDRVNSYTATARLFWARINHPVSWAYLALAFGLDFAVIYFLTQFNFQHGRQKKRPLDPETIASERRFATDPLFLWVRPDDRGAQSDDSSFAQPAPTSRGTVT